MRTPDTDQILDKKDFLTLEESGPIFDRYLAMQSVLGKRLEREIERKQRDNAMKTVSRIEKLGYALIEKFKINPCLWDYVYSTTHHLRSHTEFIFSFNDLLRF